MKTISYKTFFLIHFFPLIAVGVESITKHTEETPVSVLKYEVENLCPSIWKLYRPILLQVEIYFLCQSEGEIVL